MKSQIAILAALAGMIGWIAWTPLRQLAGERDILKRYSNVHTGMTLDQVSGVMERPPDCIIRVGARGWRTLQPCPVRSTSGRCAAQVHRR